MWGRRVALLGLVVCLSGCSSPPTITPPPPVPSWTEVRLPDAPAPVLIGDLVRCADRWYVAGGLQDAAGATGPALWTSEDGLRWQRLPVVASSSYGREQVLYSIGCRGDDLAALGATNRGQHGVPRISSWRSAGGGALTEVPAPAEQYGGARALTVTAIAGRFPGWLIAGNRIGPTSGATATVWLSCDAAGFVAHPDAVGLASSARGDTTARGVVAGPDGWFVFGDVRPPGSLVRRAAVWGSTAGQVWGQATFPADQRDASVTALGIDGDRMLAMGTLDGSPHAWSYDGTFWSDAGGFPASDRLGGLAKVGSVSLAGRDAYATADDGSRWALWSSEDLRHWRRVPTPTQPASRATSRLLLAGSDEALMLAESLEAGGRLWITPRAAAGP